jgi:preprotein translocase subunit SecF
MEFFKTNTKIPFMRQRLIAGIFSAIIFIASVLSLSIYGLNLGLDFTGGTQVQVSFPHAVDVNVIRQDLLKQGFKHVQVQQFNVRDLNVRIAASKDTDLKFLNQKLQKAMPEGKIGKLDYIGPEVSHNLMTNGILAVIVALIATLVYIAFRFDFRFAVAAILALIHDPVLILGMFSFFQLEFNMIVLTAVLTVIGYSLNDTIVVYDRIRENFRKVRKGTPKEIVDLSINQTLSRTIMTSGSTLLVVIVLFIFGGPTMRQFSSALIIGIVIGTYSSIYVAGSLALAFGMTRSSLLPASKKVEDSLP